MEPWVELLVAEASRIKKEQDHQRQEAVEDNFMYSIAIDPVVHVYECPDGKRNIETPEQMKQTGMGPIDLKPMVERREYAKPCGEKEI